MLETFQVNDVFARESVRICVSGLVLSVMGNIMKADYQRVLFSAICLFSSVHITQAAEPYASIGVGFAAERVDASASGINHPTRCDRLLYSDPLTAPGDATCTDNTVRHISNGSFKLGEALVGSASLGIAWDKARIEAEFLGRTHGGDTVLLSTRNDNPALEGKASEWSSDNPPYHRISDFRAQQLFLNVYYDFVLNSFWTPYIGAGVGLARVRTNYTVSFQRRTLADGYVAAAGGNPDQPEEWQLAAAGTLSLLDTKLGEETFGYQIVAGMERALSDRVSTFLTVRWTWFDDMSDKDVWDSIRSHRPVQADGITPFETDQALNGVGGFAATVGVRYSF